MWNSGFYRVYSSFFHETRFDFFSPLLPETRWLARLPSQIWKSTCPSLPGTGIICVWTNMVTCLGSHTWVLGTKLTSLRLMSKKSNSTISPTPCFLWEVWIGVYRSALRSSKSERRHSKIMTLLQKAAWDMCLDAVILWSCFPVKKPIPRIS